MELIAAQKETDEKNESKGFAAVCFEWVEALIPALIIIIVLLTFLFRVNIVVDGTSMVPNLHNGYRVFISCVDRGFHYGDIIVVDSNGTTLNEPIIKRVIATEGQTVNINFETGVVSVDGKELDESDYIENGITKDMADVTFPQKVPAGHVFVLGDNRKISEDSRFQAVGMIDQRHVIGKVYFILMPFSKFGKLG